MASNLVLPKVLVTGSAGHLGSALMLSLPDSGFSPIGIDLNGSDTTTLVGDIDDQSFVARVFAEHPNIKHVIHAATLHKPHDGSHTKNRFVETNISGTLHLLEAAALSRDKSGLPESFVFLSTTSAFGAALSPKKGEPAAWIHEAIVPVPKNIYGATKVAAEDLCFLIHKTSMMPVLVLRTSRFFPEEDDDEDRRTAMADDNLKVCELAYRRVDIADVVQACLCAIAQAPTIGWGKYIISALSPFANDEETLRQLDQDAGVVFKAAVPECEKVFASQGWKFLSRVDRVYDSSRAVKDLGWKPEYTFAQAVQNVSEGKEYRSELTFRVGKKGYHATSTGVYTVR